MTSMTNDTVLCTVDGGIAVLTINRPDKLNALNAAAKEALGAALAALKADPAVGAVIITGAGEKAFMAGTDIAELAGVPDAVAGRAFAEGGQALFDLIQHLGKPVIAAVNGYALGGGCELALACHIRIASQAARFGQPELTLGVIPGYGGTQRLPRIAGFSRAAEMILCGTMIDAAEALRIGLVTEVVPPEDLLPRARAAAGKILARGPVAVRLALKALNASLEAPLSEGLRIEAGLFGECCAADEFREGTGAFLAKRAPKFPGR